MRAAVVIVSVALLAIAAARCPNSCSGHGDCGGSDKCTCWANWQGFDCSERTCEYDVAWATDARQNPHYYAECSGKGICDRTTGLCTCFDGYTGSACRRSVCPNDCSGHGKCRLVAELPEANSAQSLADADATTDGSVHLYSRWDGDKIQACVCDGGFFGPDCSQRNCPKGDDPLTICNAATKQVQTLEISSSYSTLVQNVFLAQSNGLPVKGTFDLTAGGHTATAIPSSASGGALLSALSGAFVAPVAVSDVNKAAGQSWGITFPSSAAFATITSSATNLYSPTGQFSYSSVTTPGSKSFTITVARTGSEPVAGSFVVHVGANSYTVVYTASGTTLADAVAALKADTAFGTFLVNIGLTNTATSGVAYTGITAVVGAHNDEGDIIIAVVDADDPSAIVVTSFDDLLTASSTVPTITVAAGNAGSFGTHLTGVTAQFNGELVLHFTDSEGEVWTTSRIGVSGDTTDDFFKGTTGAASLIAGALAGIPNFKIPAVTVASTGADAAPAGGPLSHSWAITFDNERNSGTQNLLACDPLPLGCQTAGCSPMYQQPKTWATSAASIPASWSTSHYRTEYAFTARANSFATGPWTDSVTGGATKPTAWNVGNLPTTMSTFITADSIFDNSGLLYDQATVLVRVYKNAYSASGNWGATATDRHVYYTVEWDYNSRGVVPQAGVLPWSSCGADGHLCTTHYIPTGYEDTTHNTASGLHDAGVGYNRVPIGNGLYINLGDALAGLSSTGTNHEQLYIAFDVATVRCDVTDVAPSPQYEHLECSGRGSCDRTTGTCTCFEGHYGDHCAMQTILV